MKMSSTSSPKRSKRGIEKRVVSVPIQDVEGSRLNSFPPSDSWAWRKYGQKPIKGSPFPRGYYRCISSKGCPARKQVERSNVDPTMLVVTYSCEYNHLDRSVRASTLTREPRINYNPEENKLADLGRPDESSGTSSASWIMRAMTIMAGGVCVSAGAEEELVDWKMQEEFPLGYIAGRLPVQYLRKPVDHFLLLSPWR